MNYPEYYLVTTELSRNEITETFKQYSPLLQWRADKKDSWLDIGCGPANLTYELIMPILPSSFTKIVGADISTEMLNYAKKKYQHPKLSFRYMDIQDEDIKKYLLDENECFTHISGFFLLHYIDKQTLAMQNIYNLLEPNGDCIFLTFGENTVYNAYFKMVKNPKWSAYMWDLAIHSSYYHNKENKKEEFEKVLIAGGFTDYKIDIRDHTYGYKSLENVKKTLIAISPFHDRIPTEMQEEYLNEIIKIAFPVDNTKPNSTYKFTYKLIVAYAKK